ncbi:MAG: hypothetical protein HQL44_10670 [Alphaproteobacteria bacterium]|nr:hypothetical protein [Alphaproteobacteria bacterium]
MVTEAALRIDIRQMKQIDPEKLKIHRLSPQEEKAFKLEEKKIIEQMFTRPTGKTSYGEYARVVLNGKTVATLSNEGYAEMSNAFGGVIGSKLPNNGSGPELAQRRAEMIAKATGGTVVMNESAMTQRQWINREPIKFAVDLVAMEREGFLERWQELSGSNAAFSAQMIGQEGAA